MVNEKGVNEKDGRKPDRSPVICRLFVQTVFVKKTKWIVFFIMLGVNAFCTIKMWGFLQISYTPRMLIGITLCCSILALTNVKSRFLRAVTYIMMSAVLTVGIIYSTYYRRPLGFWLIISACIVILMLFLSGRKSHNSGFITKMTTAVALTFVFVLTIFSGTLVVTSGNSGLENGVETMWDNDSQAVFDEICADASTDKEIVVAAYYWILNNFVYDEDYYPAYQCFNAKRALTLKSGICYDFANLFTAICRSQGVRCYCLNGAKKGDRAAKHSWNRVYFDGVWWNVDLSYDIARYNRLRDLKLYGFHACENLNSPDVDFVITKIY